MKDLKKLEISEMIEISGGVNVAYEIGYAIGEGLKKIFLFKSILELL